MHRSLPSDPVRAEYNRLAAIYDQRWRRYVTQTLGFLKGWADLPPAAVVLDVACGTGAFAALLLAENPAQRIVGVDLAEAMLAIAQRRCAACSATSFQQARADALPVATAQFDAVVSANAFHYFDDPAQVLAEMRRVLRPGGQIIILDWCRDFLFCRICDALLKQIDPAHHICYTQTELHQLLETSGLTIVQARRVRFGLLWGLMIVTAGCLH
jgi:ubiquinone/menaquinone biosynthesis C-methylase UbiE